MPFGVSAMKNFFRGEYPFPQNFKQHFTCESKKSNNFLQVKADQKFQNRPIPNRVKESNDELTSSLTRPLAAEILKRPVLTSQKIPITSERYTVDSKHVLNTDRKPWSTNRLVT
jgi:hypothetical protein